MATATDQFLDLYKQLEYTAKLTYYPKSEDTENIIGRLMNHPHFAKYKEDLNYCRVVRNFLTHNPRVGGNYPIEASSAMVRLIEKLLRVVSNPPLAFDFAIKRKDMLIAKRGDYVLDILQAMHISAYTHVPVIEKGKLMGIFSDQTIYSYITGEGNIHLDGETKLSYFSQYLPLTAAGKDYYAFFPIDATLDQVQEAFEYQYENSNLLSVVFITQNGKKTEPILGMLTPWDIIINGDA